MFKDHRPDVIHRVRAIQKKCPSYLDQTVMRSQHAEKLDSSISIKDLTLRKRIDKSSSARGPDRGDSAHCCDQKFRITWEELFMGLAMLECVYSNATDSKPEKKVLQAFII